MICKSTVGAEGDVGIAVGSFVFVETGLGFGVEDGNHRIGREVFVELAITTGVLVEAGGIVGCSGAVAVSVGKGVLVV